MNKAKNIIEAKKAMDAITPPPAETSNKIDLIIISLIVLITLPTVFYFFGVWGLFIGAFICCIPDIIRHIKNIYIAFKS